MDTTGLCGLARRCHNQPLGSARRSSPAVTWFDKQKKKSDRFPVLGSRLDGKKVKIIWVQPLDKDQFGSEPKWNLAKSVFRKADAGAPTDSAEVAGVVVIFDSADGGMAAGYARPTSSSGEQDTCQTTYFGSAAGAILQKPSRRTIRLNQEHSPACFCHAFLSL